MKEDPSERKKIRENERTLLVFLLGWTFDPRMGKKQGKGEGREEGGKEKNKWKGNGEGESEQEDA